MLDKKFVTLLSVVLIISLYEILIRGDSEDTNEDSFKQFEDVEEPSYKYSKEAQDDVESDDAVKIREPTGSKEAFKPPMNMPPVTFAFWLLKILKSRFNFHLI